MSYEVWGMSCNTDGILDAILRPQIVPTLSQNEPQIVPKWFQNGPQMVPKWHLCPPRVFYDAAEPPQSP